MRRALIILGAGASLDFGVPGTGDATKAVEAAVQGDDFLRHLGADHSYELIVARLADYLGGRDKVNFEQIVHCANELAYAFPPTEGAVQEFKPILFPFVKNDSDINPESLHPLTLRMIDALHELFSSRCRVEPPRLDPLRAFLRMMRRNFRTRIYTTNYDDLVLQADGDLFYGYDPVASASPKRFEAERFWKGEDVDSVSYLHGSVHLGFPPPSPDAGLGDLHWYDDREAARPHATFSGGLGSTRRMDGSSYLQTSIVSGLDKTSSMQQSPFLHFYSALGRDAMKADVILIVGSGLTDLHVNAWLREARLRSPKPPLVLVDYWRRGLPRIVATHEHGRKEVEMVHALRMPIFDEARIRVMQRHWCMASDRSAAIWDDGFSSFLAHLDGLPKIMAEIGVDAAF